MAQKCLTTYFKGLAFLVASLVINIVFYILFLLLSFFALLGLLVFILLAIIAIPYLYGFAVYRLNEMVRP